MRGALRPPTLRGFLADGSVTIMGAGRQQSLKMMVTALCVVLAVVFSISSALRGVDQVQHQTSTANGHEHHPFSEVVFVGLDLVDSSDDSSSADPTADGGHVHHADGHSGLLSFSAAKIVIDLRSEKLTRTPDCVNIGCLIKGPERPPKHLPIDV